MFKTPKQEFTAEFKDLAVKRMRSSQGVGVAYREFAIDGNVEFLLRPYYPSFLARVDALGW